MAQINSYITNTYNRYINNNIENETINLPVHIYVKFAYQTTSATYILSRNLPLAQMVNKLRQNILRDFGTDPTQYELVEAGQTMPQGIPSEEACAFVVEPTTIRRRFNDQNHIAFYIRLFPERVSSSLNTASNASRCMVCQETPITLTTYFGCSHHICNTCCDGCIQAGITRCAICRHPR
jgi:hypothetical protein